MDKLVYAGEEKSKKAEEEFGRFNEAPPNLKEITSEEFYFQFLTWPASYTMYKQVLNHPKEKFLDLHMFIYSGKKGVAISGGRGGEPPRFWSFAVCVHDFEEKKIGNCLHSFKCKKCGYYKEIDSSG
jgi:hypothetical protein